MKRVFMAALAALLLVNLVVLVRQAESHPYRVAAKNTLAIEQTSPAWSVRTGFAPFEYLRKHVRGKRLTLSSRFDHLTWALERIARLQLTLTDQPLELDGRIFRHRRRQATASMYLTIGKKRVELYVFLGTPQDDDYVMVQYAGESALMLLPARTYRRLQPAAGPP